MSKSFNFIYSLLCYAATLVSLIGLIIFVSDVYPHFTINNQQNAANSAWLTNFGLMALFGIQHSIMARPFFKNAINKLFNPAVERANYCLGTAVAILLMIFFWQPMDGVVWQVTNEWLVIAIRVIALIGWGVLLLATFQLNHFELFGLRQTYSQLRDSDMPESTFKKVGLYRIVRHPIQTGVFIGIWALPFSTIGHVYFALGMTAYIFIGLYFEEKALVREFGQTYLEYKKEVKKIIPLVY